MSKNKKPAARSSKPKSEVIVAHCNSCDKEVPVVHTLYWGAKKQWVWQGKVCGHAVTGTRKVQ